MAQTFELNNEQRSANFVSGKIGAHSTVTNVFCDMVDGKDLSKYGKSADASVAYIKELNSRANQNDQVAVAELNELRRFRLQPAVLEDMKLLSIFGGYRNIGYNESCEIEVPEFVGIGANVQAPGQDVTFPALRMRRVPVATTTISGGHAVSYRKAALGDMSDEFELQNQIRTQIRNQAAKYVIENAYKAIKNATGVRYEYEGSGLTKTGIDSVIAKVRRWGRPTFIGDFALVSQLNGFAGWAGVTPVINGISDAAMEEIRKTGMLGLYNGTIVKELENPYDVTKIVNDADGKPNFATLMPAGLGFVIPSGVQSPIASITRGGLTSFTGNDVATGTIMTRFDLEIGSVVAPGLEYRIGMVHDTKLDDLADA